MNQDCLTAELLEALRASRPRRPKFCGMGCSKHMILADSSTTYCMT